MTDSHAVEVLLQNVARHVILPRYRSLASHEIDFKSENNPVTVADREAEAYLVEGLMALRPDAELVGEEMSHEDPELWRHLERPGAVWVIDPIDGTRSFVEGEDRFCVIVALVVDGVTEAGWVYRPTTEDLFFAERGKGAFWNGERIHKDLRAPRDEFRMAAYKRRITDEILENMSRALGRPVKRRSLFSAGLLYADVASGALDGSFFGSGYPWDHAAGVLLVQEAGGHAVYLEDGSDYAPGSGKRGILTFADDRHCSKLYRVISAGQGD